MASILKDMIEPRCWFDFAPEELHPEVTRVVERLRRGWERTCRDAALNDRAAELHAARDEYARLFSGYEFLLKGWLTLLQLDRGILGQDSLPLDRIGEALRGLQALKDEVFSGWDTLDDLYRKLMPYVTLPNDRLIELAAKNPPPASFYEEPPVPAPE